MCEATSGNQTWEFKGGEAKAMKIVPAGLMDKAMYQSAKRWVLYVRHMEDKTLEHSKTFTHSQMKNLYEEFSNIFKEVPGLPPRRTHNHHIHLLPGSEPANLRPYRHPWEQKNAIEKMIQEMLNVRIVRNSQSSYASPIVLVKKADGTWRLCVDYRALNQRTIKDEYPIRLIDELLDELQGSTVFF